MQLVSVTVCTRPYAMGATDHDYMINLIDTRIVENYY